MNSVVQILSRNTFLTTSCSQFAQMSNAQIKPVPLGVSLEYHEKLINQVGKTLKSTRAKLHESELLLNLEPPEDEPENLEKWKTKVNNMLNKHEYFQFPSLRKMQHEFEYAKLMRQQSRIRKYGTDDEMNQRANAILAKQTENMKKKVLEGGGKFGSSIKGEVLRVVPNYRGCNSHFTERRTLIRKDGRAVPPSALDSSLPPWIGPQYYEVQYPATKADTSYQMAFKALPRDALSSEVVKRSKVMERRKQLQELSHSLSIDHLPVEPHSFSPREASASLSAEHSWKSLFDADDWCEVEQRRRAALLAEDDMGGPEGSVCHQFDEEEKEKDDGQQDMEAKNKEKGEVLFDGGALENDDIDGSNSLLEVAITTFQTELSLEATESMPSQTMQHTLSLPSLVIPAPISPDRSPSRTVPPGHRQGSSDAIQRDKLLQQQPYQLKIVHAEENYFGRRWKPKDYTKDALVNQVPLQLDTYPLSSDFFALPPSVTSELDRQHSHSKAKRKSTPVSQSLESLLAENSIVTVAENTMPAQDKLKVKFSSPVFAAKPSVFRTSGEILAIKNHTASPMHQQTRSRTHSNSFDSEGVNTRPPSGANGWQDGFSKLDTSSTVTTTPHHVAQVTDNSTTTTVIHDISQPIPFVNHEFHNLSLSSSVSFSDRNKYHRNNSSSRLPARPVSQSISSYHEQSETIKGILQPKESTAKVLKKWYKQEGIMRAKYQKVSDGEKWLADRPVLPSIALSLHGLLLEENPFNGKTFVSSFEIPEQLHHSPV